MSKGTNYVEFSLHCALSFSVVYIICSYDNKLTEITEKVYVSSLSHVLTEYLFCLFSMCSHTHNSFFFVLLIVIAFTSLTETYRGNETDDLLPSCRELFFVATNEGGDLNPSSPPTSSNI